jgi:hypothetical protein
MGDGGVRKPWMVFIFLGLAACGPTYPVIKDYCPALGRALTDKERILKGLEYFYEEDERLLRDFPKGTKPSSYWVPSQLRPSDKKDTKLKPPFIPEHFHAEKRATQESKSSVNRDEFVKSYYTKFPSCCEVVEPAYQREKWDDGVMYHNGVREGTTWIKDVWVRQEYPFLKNLSINGRNDPDVMGQGELNSSICGKVGNSVADRG